MIRPSNLADAEAIAAMLRERAAWMDSRGIEPWKPAWFADDVIAGELRQHEYFVKLDGARIVGCYRLQWQDQMFWPGDDTPAGYVHRLCVALDHAGRGIGRELLDDFEQRVRASDRRIARLDCWADNPPLVRLYENAGYRLVNVTSVRAGFRSALMEKTLVDG